MFDIEYKGGNSVVVATKKVTLVIDPKRSVIGQSDLKNQSAVQIATEPRFQVEEQAFRISFEGPGEYEVSDISIRGVAARRHIDAESTALESTIYRLTIGDIKLAVLGNIDPKLTEDQLEAIGMVDIVILPVGGGGYTLDATSASALVRQIEPNVVVPVHYADPALTYEVPQDSLETFTKELSAPVDQVGSKYKVKTASSIPQALTIVEIERS